MSENLEIVPLSLIYWVCFLMIDEDCFYVGNYPEKTTYGTGRIQLNNKTFSLSLSLCVCVCVPIRVF